MNLLSRTAKLLLLIIREGIFRHSGHRFELERQQMLAGLERFCRQAGRPQTRWAGLRRWVFGTTAGKVSHPVLAAWLTQAALVKKGLRERGGHLCVPELKLCGIRNPKAASTAVAAALLQRLYPELTHVAPNAAKVNFLADANLYEHVPTWQKNFQFFMVVRNPFARIVSLYRNFFEGDHFIYEDYLFGILKKDMTFHEFVRTVELIPDAWKDQHFRPQAAFLRYYEKKNVDVTLLKIEGPETVQKFLSGFGLVLPSINRNKPSRLYHEYFTEETARAVYRMFEEDIRRFGYEKDWTDLWNCVSRRQPPDPDG